ncbi:MAG: hypothetical protein ACR2L9_09755 [Solirubrobacteraceae bacterium]
MSAGGEHEVMRAPEGREAVSAREGAAVGPTAGAPPPGEEIHIPGPTALPFVCAIGITLVVIGTTIDWMLSIVGLVIVAITVTRWIRDNRRDVQALPETHH